MGYRKKIVARFISAQGQLLRGGWASLEAIIGPLVMLLLSPLLLSELGTEDFGKWILAISISGFTNVASIGAGAAVTYFVAEYTGNQQTEKIGCSVRAGLSLVLSCYGLVSLAAGVGVAVVLTGILGKFGQIHGIFPIILLGINALYLQEIDTVYASALRGMQRYDVVGIFEVISRPLWGACIATATIYSKDVLVVLIVHNVFFLVRAIARERVLAGVVQNYAFGVVPSLKELRKILGYGKWVSVQGIGGVLFSTVDKFLVTGLFGLSDVGRYSLCLQLVQFTHNIQAAAFQVITPWIVLQRIKYVDTGFRSSRLAVICGLGAMVLPIIGVLSSDILLKLWLGDVFAQTNGILLVVLFTGAAALAFSIPVHFVALGMGKVKQCAIILFAAGVVAVITSASLSIFGLMGFAIGRLAYGIVSTAQFYLIREKSHSGKIYE